MKHLKRKNGFALVELVVGIAAASLVLAAASSLLLMGARIQRTLRDEAQEQQTIRIVLTMLEDLVAEGKIKSIEPIVETNTDGWQLKGETEPALLTFSNQTLYAGGSVLLENVSATANLNGNLLNFTFTTDRGKYETSTYCRTVVIKDEGRADIAKSAVYNEAEANSEQYNEKKGEFQNTYLTVDEKDARYAFLQTLCEEYGSTGRISGEGQYYSKWYNASWSSSTPWCACFLSWAAAKNATSLISVPKFANVNKGEEWFSTGSNGTFFYKRTSTAPPSYTPIPGDYIFFDWECDDDPDHVGAVLFVNGTGNDTTVYTIEGNSGGRVAIHSYNINDPRIYGYGVLNWKTSAGT